MRMEQLWPLGLLILLPLIVIFYILKEKAQDRKVSSLRLWQEAYQSLEARTPWEKLKNNLLMYLQLLVVLLLILALCGPYLSQGGRAASDVVIAIDTSGSMSSIYYEKGKNTGKTRLQEAKRQALEYVEALPESTKITLIEANQKTRLVFTGKTDRHTIKKEIKNLSETDLKGDISGAVDMIKSMEAQWEDCQTVLFTDEVTELGTINAEMKNLASGGANLSLIQVSHRLTEEGTADVLVRVENTGSIQKSSDVNLYLDGELESIQAVDLMPGESQVLHFTDKKAKETITAEINEADDLASDNTGYDTILKQEEKSILLVSEKNVFLEKALSSIENAQVYKTNDISNLEKAGVYDFYIFDGIFPEVLPQEGSLLLIHPSEGYEGLFEVTGEEEGIWIQEEGGSFGFGVSALYTIETPRWARAFYTAGEYGAGFSGEKAGQRITVLAFDIHESEWPLLPEFPLKMYEIAQESMETSLLSENKVTAGAYVNVNAPGGSWTYTETEKCGFYPIGEGEEREILAVNFPEEESRVWQKGSLAAGDSQNQKGTIRTSLPLRNFFILAILLLLLIEWLVYYRQGTFEERPRGQKIGIMLLRGAVFLCLFLAWVNPSIVLGGQPAATVFLIDASDSVSGREEEGTAFVRAAIDALPEEETSGVIAFGKEARVEQFMSQGRQFSDLETRITRSATNLNQAVTAALGMFPDNAPKRLVLLTDGKENEGTIAQLSGLLKEKKIKLLVHRWETAAKAEVSVESVTVPDKVNIDDVFKITINIKSNVETAASLSLYAGNEKKGEKQLELQKGNNQFVFTDTQTAPGLKSYRAIVEPLEDSISINNEYCAYTQAEVQDMVLLIEGQPGQGSEFEKLLQAANVSYQKLLPAGAPRTLMELSVYRSVLLLDVYAPDLPSGFMNNIEAYVRDYGGGLIALGGSSSFALGGYRDTPLETVLPVDMDLKGEKEVPKMAMVMVIDRSGSMSQGDGKGTQLTLAKEAALEALHSLREDDEAGVIAFESTYDWVASLQKVSTGEAVKQGIESIALGGGTSIYPALEAAFKSLEASDAKRKHIILLTDGQDGYRDYGALLSEIQEEEITLSTVAVGEGSDQSLLSSLASQGGGRSYYTDINSDIPRIFAQEVFLGAKDYLVNREFTPVISSNSGLIREAAADGVPKLYGYVATSEKERAQVHLASDEEDPIYATWQYGLGRTAVFTSDVENQWTRDWAAWDGYPVLIKKMINWTMTDTYSGENQLEIKQRGNQLNIAYELREYSENSSAEAVLTDEKGNQQILTLKETVPGTFEGDISLEETGIYGISVRQKEKGEIVSARNTAAALQYSEEYRLNEDISGFEQFVEENEGIYITDSSQVAEEKPEEIKGRTSLGNWFLLLCVFLFFIDIIIRRFRFHYKRKRKPARKAGKKVGTKMPAGEGLADGKAPDRAVADSARKTEADKISPKKGTVKSKSVRKRKKDEEKKLDTSQLLKKKEERKGE